MMKQPGPVSTETGAVPDISLDPNRPVTAVFLLNITRYTGPLLAGWVEAGNRIGAIVVPGFPRRRKGFSIGNFRRGLQRKRLLRRYLGRLPVKLIEFGRPYDWGALRRQLSGMNADVLVSYAFPALIPQDVLGGFPKGGINLHPSLLPNYRGPHPVQRMVVDGQHHAHGGVTLHKMSAGYDEGDILANIAFSEADWSSKQSLARSTAAAYRMLVSEVAPAYCRGGLSGAPQPAGAFLWARLEQAHMMIQPSMTMDHAALLWRVLGMVPGIYLKVAGSTVRLGFQMRKLGPPTGMPAIRRWARIEFDLADGRVVYFTHNRLLKRLINLHARFAATKAPEPRLEIKRFGQSAQLLQARDSRAKQG